ncbi:hypothetical protein HOLleu_10991 [Holothuria leucospilota]|uniref:Uncharacterized protein n=1 Tax=Holothuria leucospilota TaxID=206669 RepID=A0A9Q1CEA9_HOLLE|nr:hypothetical protein HOLleu_10991 [Holothuria leucospilota]
MYLQIELYDEDKPMLRFLWRDLDSSKEPQIYEYCRVVFGINTSPFIALKVSQQSAQKYKDELPLAAETVLKSTYMDDSLDSVIDEQVGLELYNQLITLWGQAGMKPMKWVFNSKAFLEAVPKEQRAKSDDIFSRGMSNISLMCAFYRRQSGTNYSPHTIRQRLCRARR